MEMMMTARSIVEDLERRIAEIKAEIRGLENDWKFASMGEGSILSGKIDRANDELEFLENLVDRAK